MAEISLYEYGTIVLRRLFGWVAAAKEGLWQAADKVVLLAFAVTMFFL